MRYRTRCDSKKKSILNGYKLSAFVVLIHKTSTSILTEYLQPEL